VSRRLLLEFDVPGEPVPTSRPQVVRTKSGKSIAFMPGHVTDYQALVAMHAHNAKVTRMLDAFPWCRPVALSVLFRRSKPHRADADNLVKGVMDALVKSRVLADDSYVVELHVFKTQVAPAAAGANVVLEGWWDEVH
jgi:Holliday junction resolvase RusA-like endonuclease